MPWTGEDTKDVFKKVIGGLIAAAFVAMGYAVIEEMRWYFAAVIGLVILLLVLLLLLWMRTPAAQGRAVPDRADAPETPAASPVGPKDAPVQQPMAQEVPRDERAEKDVDDKSLKKIAKADQKKAKKEAKAEKKREE